MSDRPILITGSQGMLAAALRWRLAKPDLAARRTLWTDVEELDITSRAAVDSFLDRERPAIILNCAGLTNVDGAERERARAFAVNAEAVANLAQAANRVEALLVQISTDYIFAGDLGRPYREDDSAQPLNVYGESKLAGEAAARAAAQHLIVRTAWLYGPQGNNFVKTMCDLAGRSPELRVVGDQVGCPTYTRDLAEAMTRLMQAQARGTFHAAGGETISWFGFAKAIVELWKPELPVREIATAEMPRPARRPAFSALDCGKLAQAIGYQLPSFRASLPDYLETLRSR